MLIQNKLKLTILPFLKSLNAENRGRVSNHLLVFTLTFRVSHAARKFPFNPCFSPTVSDDELSVHDESDQPTSSQSECMNRNTRNSVTPIRDESSHSVFTRPIANVAGGALRAAKDLRARLALVAHAENQQHGPANLRRLSNGSL